MSTEKIYERLRAAGLSHAGVCGLMGNLMAESGLVANIAQRGMTTLSDEDYTAKFDNYPDTCIRDSVGYGLAQWSFWSRKQALWNYAMRHGKSVGDGDSQLDFIVFELGQDYPGLLDYLRSTEDIYAATDRVCREYERPAVNNVDRRYEFALRVDMQCRDRAALPGGKLSRIIPLVEEILSILKEESA